MSNNTTLRPCIRNRDLFVQQSMYEEADPELQRIGSVDNLVWISRDPEKKWLETSMVSIGDSRSLIRTVYCRWALIMKSLIVTRDVLTREKDACLTIDAWRSDEDSAEGKLVELAIWDGQEAARRCRETQASVASHGFQDMYGALEEIVLSLYECFMRAHPRRLIQGDEFKPLRKLRDKQDKSPEEEADFRQQWEARVASWRRHKTHEGLHRVFKSYWNTAGLKRPRHFRSTDIEDWAHSIELLGTLRNLITHGEGRVSKELAELSAAERKLDAHFEEGEELNIGLVHLLMIESFCDELLDIINMSLFELSSGHPVKAVSAS